MTIKFENREIVIPGEVLAQGEYKTGSGVVKHGDRYYPSIVGTMNYQENRGELSVRPLRGKYFPKVGDLIIGIVEDVNLTSWIVNIRGPYSGVLLASNAVRGRFDPIKDDARRILKRGDVVRAEIVSFDRTRDPMLTTKDHGLGKQTQGRIVEINPNHIPRLVGRKGSMIMMIKDYTNSRILVGQNGRVWIKAESAEQEELVIQAINQISREAHVSGLTDRIKQFLKDNTR